MDDTESALKKEIQAYKKIRKAAASQEVSDIFDMMLRTVTEKMIWAFTTGKDGDNVKTWDDFCKVRGEIVARLQPIQEARDAGTVEKHLQEQLDNYYGKQI